MMAKWAQPKHNKTVHQQDPQPLDQVPDGILLLLACTPGLGPGKFPELLHRLLVPATQCLHREGDEADVNHLCLFRNCTKFSFHVNRQQYIFMLIKNVQKLNHYKWEKNIKSKSIKP
jgi:hypothetical protein